MKKTLLGILCLGYILSIQAQTLYGTTFNGGTDGQGTIDKFIPATDNLTVAKSFENINSTDGLNSSASLIQACDGKLYGMTVNGGSSSSGVIFSFDPFSSTFTKLKDFDVTQGGLPYGSLIQASDSKLYGMTYEGPNDYGGVIFSFDVSTSIYTILFALDNYDGTSGGLPYGSLIQARDGKLYGMTSFGGGIIRNDPAINVGVIFSIDPLSSTPAYTYAVPKIFQGTDGASPYGSFIQATDGKLYGMTSMGGSGGSGVIFSFIPSTSTYEILKQFDGTDGANPYGSLIQAGDGKLYGMTYGGGSHGAGVIFSYDPISFAYTVLENFDYTNGSHPYGNLMQASDGKLYGMTSSGGISDDGVIFSFDPHSLTYTKLTDYNGANGANPYFGSAFIDVTPGIASTTYYQDRDGDGYGNPAISVHACTQPAGYVTNNTDCDDNNAAIHAPVTYYRDADGDGLGDPNNSISVCETTPPAGYVRNNYDCNDHFKPWRFEDKRLLMCHDGEEDCIKMKDVWIKLFEGWTLGPCTKTSCGPNETLMCHKGKEDCIKRKDVLKKLFEGWTFGQCFSRTTSSEATMDVSDNPEINGKEQSIPGQYKLANYPNPFKEITTIKYELPFDSKVSIKCYDVMGRFVATLVDEDKKAGTYTIDFQAGHLSRGSLFYRIIATSNDNQFQQTNEMIQLQ